MTSPGLQGTKGQTQNTVQARQAFHQTSYVPDPSLLTDKATVRPLYLPIVTTALYTIIASYPILQ